MAVRHLSLASLALALGCASATGNAGAVTPEQASTSLYAHPWTWHDDSGASVALSRWRGTPVIVTAIYTTCSKTCPRTVAKLRRVEKAFGAAGKPVQLVLVSLDPEHDTPERLRAYKEEAALPDTWHLLRGSADTTRELTDLLDMHLLTMDEHIMHESRILVFDAEGRAKRSFECCGFAEEAAVP